MDVISLNAVWCYTGDEFGYTYVPLCFCRQESEKLQCRHSSVSVDSPLFLNKRRLLLHQNRSLTLKSLTPNNNNIL